MAQDEQFRIKGAAQTSDLPGSDSLEPTDQPTEPTTNTDQAEEAEEAEEAQSKKEGESKTDDEEKKEEASDDAKNLAKYKWYKCENPQQGPGVPAHYYTNTETGASSWTEPDEPYWIYNIELAGPDPLGLQYPAGFEQPNVAQKIAGTHPLAYNPKIHGNYDPNADYAKYTEQRLGGTTTTTATGALTNSMADYTATMALNARTGSAQPSNLSADRHNDFAKSGRQMNAFFDVDAAANAHEGKSLKEERKNKRLTKEEVKAFNEARKEKKQKKRLAFYKS